MSSDAVTGALGLATPPVVDLAVGVDSALAVRLGAPAGWRADPGG
ncbi:hypothetical protein ACN263_09005 [Micromonospora sp. WMMD729]